MKTTTEKRYNSVVYITAPAKFVGRLPLPDRMQCPTDDITDRYRAEHVCECVNMLTGLTAEVRTVKPDRQSIRTTGNAT